MHHRILLLSGFLFLLAATVAAEQPRDQGRTFKRSQASLDLERRKVDAEVRIPVFEFNKTYYSRSKLRPDIFQSIATILTKDVRQYKSYLITDVVWEHETGNMLCIQAEPPSTQGVSEKFYASEIRSVTIRGDNGRMRYYVYDDKKQALRPALRGIIVEAEIIDRYASDRKRRSARFGPGSVERIQPTKEEVTNCGLERPEVRFTK